MPLRAALTWLSDLVHLPGRTRRVFDQVDGMSNQAVDLIQIKDLLSANRELLQQVDYLSQITALNSATLSRRLTTPTAPYHVLFLIHNIGTFPAVAPIIEHLRAAADFRVTVASIEPRYVGVRLNGEDYIHRHLTDLGVPHLRLPFEAPADSLAVIERLAPDVIFRQSQWDVDLPPAFSTLALSFSRLCLVPYETMTFLTVPEQHKHETNFEDSRYHRACWKVFCANPQAQELAQAEGILQGSQYVVTGHPKQEYFQEATPWWPLENAIRRPRVAWFPHHSIGTDWINFGLFDQMIEPMIALAGSRPDCDFVLRAHPTLWTRIKQPHSPIPPLVADAAMARWNALPNTAVYDGADYAGLVKGSDVVLTDGVSLIFEAQLAPKPIVFIERADHRPLNQLGRRALDGVHRVATVEQGLATAMSFADGRTDELRAAQVEVVQDLLAYPDAAARIVAELRRGLAQGEALNLAEADPTALPIG